MPRYIEMNALIEFANNHKEGKIDSNDIARFPISDVQAVKHGKWISHEDELGVTFECSVCHMETCSETPFCPRCGAEMGKKDE